jgi:hypothetical protein
VLTAVISLSPTDAEIREDAALLERIARGPQERQRPSGWLMALCMAELTFRYSPRMAGDLRRSFSEAPATTPTCRRPAW